MKYKIDVDLKLITSSLGITVEKLANNIGVARETLSRIENGSIEPSDDLLEKIYSFAYQSGIELNKAKVNYYSKHHEVLVFHGSKNIIDTQISLDYSRKSVDLGKGFYTGENYEQSLDFVCNNKSPIYIIDVDYNALKIKTFDLSIEWLMAIALNRGLLKEFQNSKYCKNLEKELDKYDVIIAPIADNRMFNIIESFSDYQITTEQAIHALKALSLGNQIVFKTEKAISQIKLLEQLYVCKSEREQAYKTKITRIKRTNDYIVNAYKEHLREGKYLSEVIKDGEY